MNRKEMERHFSKLKLALAAMALLSLPPQGFANTSYGEVNQTQSARQQAVRVTGIVQINPTTVEVRFSDNQRMTLDFYGENIFPCFKTKREASYVTLKPSLKHRF